MREKKKFGFTIVFTIILAIASFVCGKTDFLTNVGLAYYATTEAQQKEILEDIRDGRRVVALYGMDRESFDHFVDLVYDEPRFYWLDMEYKALSIGDLSVLMLKEKYSDIEYLEDLINQKVDMVINDIIEEDMDEYEKALAIHDWICVNVRYAETYNDGDQEVYGALIEKKARCAGYAKLFTILLDKVGIESEVISGTSLNDGEEVPHAWNLAYIDDKPYYFDVTWDDEDDALGYNHHWFGVTKYEFSKTHFPSAGYGWNEGAVFTDACYYIREGKYIQSYNYKHIVKQILAQGRSFSIKCANEGTVDKFLSAVTVKSELQKIMMETGIKEVRQITYELSEGVNCLQVKLD